MRSLVLLLAVLCLSAFAALGCGNDGGASSATELAPAGALMYGETELDPAGDQKRAIETLAAKFPGSGSAGERLQGLIEEGLEASDAPITFEPDIEPWLGDTAGFFVSGNLRNASPTDGAALIATDDEDAARDAIEKSFEGKQRERSYEGVDYLVGTSDDDAAAGVFDGFVVLGTERALKAVVDTSEGGKPLSDDDTYKEAIADAPEDRLGLFYLNSPQLFEATQGDADSQSFRVFKDFFKDPYVATFDVDGDGVSFEADAPESLAKVFAFFGEGSDFVNDVPADSWLALAQPDLGKVLGYYVDAFGAGAGGRDVIEDQLRAMTGLDLQPDVLGWMGDFAIFVRGTSLSELNGGIVIETTDPAASGRLLTRLASLGRKSTDVAGAGVAPLSAPGGGKGFTLRGRDLPQPVHVFQRGDRVVVAYGDAAAKDAIDPAQKLGDSREFTEATKSLGDYTISMYAVVAPILQLVDSTESGSDPDWQKAKPYLEPLKALVGGTSGDEDQLRSAFKLLID
jgi:Protein of unknown function (DUF3352)